MKINSLLESQTPSSSTTNTTNSAPEFSRDDEHLEETTTSGSVATVASPVGGMQRRGKGSMFAGIKTSAKFPNSEAVKEGLPKNDKDEFKRQALLVKDRKTGKLYDPNVEFDKKMNSPEVKAQMKRMATKESQINEVDPRNFDSDEDYYAAKNAPAKPRYRGTSSPGVNQDDEAYFREIFRKKRLAAQQAERDADHDRLATGTNEGEEMGTFAALKDWRVWDVRVFNNFYRGKYADYGPRLYSVVASSPEEARQVVINNPDYVLQDLLSRKLQNGKKVLPRGSALPIEEKRVGKADPGSITTMGFKKMLTPDGVQSFKFTGGKIVDGSHTAGGEQVNEKSKSQAQFRTMAAVANNPEFAKKVGISQKVGKEFHSADKKQDYKSLPKEVDEQGVAEEKQRLDPKCWTGYKKQGTKMKGDTRVNNCVPVEEGEVTRTSTGIVHRATDKFGAGEEPFNPQNPGKYARDLDSVNKKSVKDLDASMGINYKNQGTKGVKVDEAELNETDMLAKELFKQLDLFKKGADKDIGSKAKDRELGNKPQDKDIVTKGGFNGEYDDEAGSVESNLLTTARAVKGLLDTIEDRDNLPEWVQEKIAKAEGMLVTSWDYLLSQKEQGIDPQVDEDWQKTNKQDKTDGMSPKAVKAYRRENPGSKLKTAVTKKPSELKAGSKDAKRRKSFCARMSGNKGPMKDENGKPTPKAKALKRWNC